MLEMTRNEYAKHRGVSRMAISKLARNNWLVFTVSGKIDVEKTDLFLTGVGKDVFSGLAEAENKRDIADPLDGYYNVSDKARDGKNNTKFNEGNVLDDSDTKNGDNFDNFVSDNNVDLNNQFNNNLPTEMPSVDGNTDYKGQIKALVQKSAFYRAQLIEYKAKLAKFKYDTEKSSYISSTEVEQLAFECGRQIKESLLNIPKRLAPVVSHEIYTILTQEIEAVLRTITVSLQGIAETPVVEPIPLMKVEQEE